ncbi:MAG: glycoside hydrolase family 97 protein [Bacteroidota bacterium]
MKYFISIFLILSFFAFSNAEGKDFTLKSPDTRISITISINKLLVYSVSIEGKNYLNSCSASLKLDNNVTIGLNETVAKEIIRSVNDTIHPVIKEKRRLIIDRYNELKIYFQEGNGLIFRAYNDGIAYRFFTSFENDIKIIDEQADFSFADNYTVMIPYFDCRKDADCFHTSFESNYITSKLNELQKDKLAFTPVYISDEKGPKFIITESDLDDYSGMFLTISGTKTLKGVFAKYPLKEELTEGEFPQLIVKERADYIAVTKGTREFPWRVILIADADKDLVENDLVYRLASPLKIKDTSWIKPGKSTEEWIVGRNYYGVDFKTGINTATYKFLIDFASKFELEYIMLDAGWSDYKDLFKINPGLNLVEVINYAKEKNVEIILWTLSSTLDKQMKDALDWFVQLGVKGFMTDFMDRDDQKIVNFYKRVAEESAKRKLLVNFHGAFKPTGLQRAYPNLITREGVLGHEFNMWSESVTPDHMLTIPFIRMTAGPMDFEGGSMSNAQQKDFRAIFERPMNQGTRTQQAAIYVVYESPLQYLAGNHSDYLREPEFTKFIANIPTTWDETICLEGKAGDYIIVARKNNNKWYVAAMTDWTPREFEIDLKFLDDAKYNAQICEDGINADRNAEDYKITNLQTNKNQKLKIKLVPGGGWVGIFIPVQK